METRDLVADRPLLNRTSTAERVAAILRTRISEGDFRPGTQLAEEEIRTALGISRNTLREAFRLLGHERLLVHRLNRGVFVREPDRADVVDLYRLRKHLECSVLRTVVAPPAGLPAIEAAVKLGEQALAAQDWQALGTANIQFHEALTAIADSERITELMRAVLAELRLVFHAMDNPRWFHEPYLARNTDILAALRAGDGAGAGELLYDYLDDAERQLVNAYADRRVDQVQ